ncbi:condensation domain-containing protein [Streptomyces sp. NPDC060000]|uniref:condensation domain-containing protein n=1 Tax=Streptomyces sp. NPDC060000 TaxID=3347031 RepID=UPI0036920FDE
MPSSHPLSHAQQALWFLRRLAPDSGVYNTGVALRIRSTVDVSRLGLAIAETAGRHELARSTFDERDAEPVRLLHERPLGGLEVRDLGDVDDQSLADTVRTELVAPFSLERSGAFRFVLLRRNPTDSVLLIAGHHIATDATSNWLVLRDLMQTYRRLTEGEDHRLATPAGSYDTYVAKEGALLASPRGARMERYWHELCDGAVPAAIPTDRARPAVSSDVGRTHHIDLGEDRLGPLREAARASGVSLFSFLLGTFQSVLHRFTRQNGFLVGCPTTTRLSPAMREVVGNFINTLVFRAEFTPATTFRQAALAADQQVKNGLARVGYPFELLTRTANRPRTSAGSSICRITFNMIGTPTPDPLLRLLLDGESTSAPLRYADLLLSPYELPQAEGQLDLAVSVRQSAESLAVDFRYDVDLFDPATIETFARYLVRGLDAAIADPDGPVARLRLMNGAELARLLALGTGGGTHG